MYLTTWYTNNHSFYIAYGFRTYMDFSCEYVRFQGKMTFNCEHVWFQGTNGSQLWDTAFAARMFVEVSKGVCQQISKLDSCFAEWTSDRQNLEVCVYSSAWLSTYSTVVHNLNTGCHYCHYKIKYSIISLLGKYIYVQ